MRIVFDPEFEQGCWPGPLRGGSASAGEDWVGPSRFAQFLRRHSGSAAPDSRCGSALPVGSAFSKSSSVADRWEQ